MGLSIWQELVPVPPPKLPQEEWEKKTSLHRPPLPHLSDPTPRPLGRDALIQLQEQAAGRDVETERLWDSCHLNTGAFRSQGPLHIKDNDLCAFPSLHESEAKYNFLMASPQIWKICMRMSYIIKLDQRSVWWWSGQVDLGMQLRKWNETVFKSGNEKHSNYKARFRIRKKVSL